MSSIAATNRTNSIDDVRFVRKIIKLALVLWGSFHGEDLRGGQRERRNLRVHCTNRIAFQRLLAKPISIFSAPHTTFLIFNPLRGVWHWNRENLLPIMAILFWLSDEPSRSPHLRMNNTRPCKRWCAARKIQPGRQNDEFFAAITTMLNKIIGLGAAI